MNGFEALGAARSYTKVNTSPIGTVISFMGTKAPENHVVCDGAVYNVSDYPAFCDYLVEQFGKIDFFGGDGSSTFAVPDLRGEFLRGAGTNSRENQGSGSAPGVHQDATEIMQLCSYNGALQHFSPKENIDVDAVWDRNMDSGIGIRKSSRYGKLATKDASTYEGMENAPLITTRPTNTSVFYCIKVK